MGTSVAFPVIGLGLDAQPLQAGFAAAVASSEVFKGAMEGVLSAAAGPKIGGQLARLGGQIAAGMTQNGGIAARVREMGDQVSRAWSQASWTGAGKAIGGWMGKALAASGRFVNIPGRVGGLLSGIPGLIGGGLRAAALPITALNQGGEFLGKIVRLLGEPFRQLSALEETFSRFTLFAGSANSANSALDRFRATARATGMDLGELSGAVAPLMGAGWGFEEAINGVQRFSRAAAVLGPQSLGALTQAAASFRGELFASEQSLNQVAAMGLPIWSSLAGVLSQVYGRQISITEASEMVTNQLVTGANALAALDRAANGPAVMRAFDARGNTFAGLMDQLGNTWNEYMASLGNFWVNAIDVKSLLATARGFLEGLSQPIQAIGDQWGAALDPGRLTEAFGSARDAGLSFARFMLDTMVTVGEWGEAGINKLIDGINLLGEVATRVRNFLDPSAWGRSIMSIGHEMGKMMMDYHPLSFATKMGFGKSIGDLVAGENQWNKPTLGATWEGFGKLDGSSYFGSARNWIANTFAGLPGGADREKMGGGVAGIANPLNLALESANKFTAAVSQASGPMDTLSRQFAQYEAILANLVSSGANAAQVSAFQVRAQEMLATAAGQAFPNLLATSQALEKTSWSAGAAALGNQEFAASVLRAMAPASAPSDRQTQLIEAMRQQVKLQQEQNQIHREILGIWRGVRGAPVVALRG